MDALTLCVILNLSTKNIPLNVLQTVLKIYLRHVSSVFRTVMCNIMRILSVVKLCWLFLHLHVTMDIPK